MRDGRIHIVDVAVQLVAGGCLLSGKQELRRRIGLPACSCGCFDEPGVATRMDAAGGEVPQVGLVPDLEVVGGVGGDIGVRLPESSSRSVSLCDLGRVLRELGRVRWDVVPGGSGP